MHLRCETFTPGDLPAGIATQLNRWPAGAPSNAQRITDAGA